MTTRTRKIVSYILMALISSHIWYYILVDILCDVSLYEILYPLAQLLAIILPFICCFIWDKEKERNRFAFVLIYFLVLGACDYLHSFLYNIVYETVSYFKICDNYMLLKDLFTVFMVIVRMVLSSSLLSWCYKYALILIAPKES